MAERHRKRTASIAVLLALLASNGGLVRAASAAGTISYGGRSGMEVTVLSMDGLDTERAIIRTKHTRQNAIVFCRDYVGEVTEKCISMELAEPLNDRITANCRTGVFTTFSGDLFRFSGPNKNRDLDAKFRFISLRTGEVADGSYASGYPVLKELFKALCPNKGRDVD